MPIWCCPRRPTTRARTSCAPTGPITCSSSRRWCRRRGRRGRIAGWPQELARRLGVKDPVFSMDTDGLIRALFRNARGPAATMDPAAVRTAGPIRVTDPIAVGAGPALRHAVEEARVLLGDARRPGAARPARLAAGSRRGRARPALAAAAPHRARAISRRTRPTRAWPGCGRRRARPSACSIRTTPRRGACTRASRWSSTMTAAR